MKVRCVKLKIEKSYSTIITNSSVRSYLTIGSVFYVYGLRFSSDVIYVYIFEEAHIEHLFEVPIDLFEIVDEKCYPHWLIRRNSNDDITLWPELFYESDFLEKFSEFDSEERKKFNSLQELIEMT